jgi:hypothetical protein
VVRILCIPVKQGMEDLLAWHYGKNGVFSVKLACVGRWQDTG